MTPPAAAARERARAQRTVGMALSGSALALVTVAALAWAGALPVDPAVRGWVAAGAGAAAVLDALIGLFFLRASSQS